MSGTEQSSAARGLGGQIGRPRSSFVLIDAANSLDNRRWAVEINAKHGPVLVVVSRDRQHCASTPILPRPSRSEIAMKLRMCRRMYQRRIKP